jgi:hypothetical protein
MKKRQPTAGHAGRLSQLEHPLMAIPLGTLPELTRSYTDELPAKVVVQARLGYRDL